MELKGRKGQCLYNKKWERDPQYKGWVSESGQAESIVSMVWPDNWRVKYGRERTEIALKKREAQAEESMWTASDTVILWV